MDDRLSKTIQLSLLTLLAMDKKNSLIIRNSLPVESFEGAYNPVARAAYAYIDEFHKAPTTNLDNELDDILRKDNRKSKRVLRVLAEIRDLHERGHNADHIMSRLDKRLRYHRIRVATRELLGIFNAGQEDDAAIDQMETILGRAVRDRVEAFNPGTMLGDKKRALHSLLRDDSEDAFPTGIKELDDYKLGPKRRQLHLLIGLKKVGKTRWLVQLAQHAAMSGAKVLHISLEMDEERMVRRYYQSFFAIAQERRTIHRKKFKKDEFGRLIRIRNRKAKLKMSLDDRGIRKALVEKIDRFGNRLNRILIKSFPTRQLTFNALVAYIDRLEMQEGFIPDLLIIDYPKLMNLPIDNLRLALGALLEDLRGLGVERNMAVATVAQSHRMRKGQEGVVDSGDVGEDFSQTQTLDVGLVFRQTREEAKRGLARILVDDARDAPTGWEVLISQNYEQGQFCVDSVRMRSDYWDMINTAIPVSGREDEG